MSLPSNSSGMGEGMTDKSTDKSQNKFSLGWSPSGYAAAAIGLGLIMFLAINVFASVAFRAARLDLTEQHLYTLSSGTMETLSDLREPITLRFYFSESLIAESQLLQTYGAQVRSLLGEYVAHANGNLILEVIDPEPYTEAEDEAVASGLGRAQLGGDQVFFGLVGTNSIDGREIIPFFVPDREEFLEYDLTQLISRLNETQRPKLGIVTNLSLDTGIVDMGAVQQGVAPQPYYVYQQLQSAFEIVFLEQDFDQVPDDISVLMIAHPRELDEGTQYAIDQFVLGGGRALVFVDPYSEVSMVPGPSGMPMRGATESSNLPRLLNAWGVDMDGAEVVADRTYGAQVPANFDPRRGEITYVAWLNLGPESYSPDELVTEPLQRGINLGTVGHLEAVPGATTTIIPLISSSTDSMLIPVDEVQYQPDMDRLLRDFDPTPQQYVIAARITGPAQTAFPDGPPADDEDTESDEPQDLSASTVDPADQLMDSDGPINVIVMADTDIFDDAIYVLSSNMGSGTQRVSGRDNDAFILNAVDFLMGTNSLLTLRARAISDRPFEVVEDLRRGAEARFLEEEQQLQTRLDEVSQRLRELQGQVRGSGSEAAPDLNLRRQQELARFRQEQIETRQRLREVQRSLRVDIESLGFWIKALNITLIPALICLLALGLIVLHRMRRAERLRRRG
ncbi:MAG: ABC transporter [Sphingomonadales bacterium]|nr:MAG: ABC transporter [Sphingomonadales bacterium]